MIPRISSKQDEKSDPQGTIINSSNDIKHFRNITQKSKRIVREFHSIMSPVIKWCFIIVAKDISSPLFLSPLPSLSLLFLPRIPMANQSIACIPTRCIRAATCHEFSIFFARDSHFLIEHRAILLELCSNRSTMLESNLQIEIPHYWINQIEGIARLKHFFIKFSINSINIQSVIKQGDELKCWRFYYYKISKIDKQITFVRKVFVKGFLKKITLHIDI